MTSPLTFFQLPFLMVFFLFPLLISPAAAAATAATVAPKRHPHFQHINVTETIASTRIQQPSQTTSQETKIPTAAANSGQDKIKLNLLHRETTPFLQFQPSHDYRHRFSARMHRDATTVAYLTRRLNHSDRMAAKYEVEDLGADVVSGMEQGSGEYFVRIGVGSPPKDQYMVIDSGSDIVWVQCQPCRLCYRQSDPVFDPASSASFAGVSCSSTVCDRLQNTGCHSGRCRYEVQYGDGSYTKGTLAIETLTFGDVTVQNVAIGCGHTNRGLFVGASGLLGLGGGSMSFIGQMGGQTGGAFSYCLVSRGNTGSTGSLEFGRGSLPVGAAWVPLLRNSHAPSFYYIGLSGLGVGSVRVPIPEDSFKLTESGLGGVVMDTGTAVTRLPLRAYVAFRDAFVSQTQNLPRLSSGVSIFDTCYDLKEFVTVRVPTVSFYFTGGAILTLPARNFLIPVDGWGTFCFAFAPSSSELSIIGNIQQEGIQISVDGANGFVGFGPNVC
ncbi:protein ASPARTIC PROTEASE IN GUARD CELL 2-like [Impatiens glandulifera]|uniref:protein ASPARTIC PROTEASE IN GUARD CELL 2-like n=1 Tax=Impatiens glandulifera TaxID=253017 RepID=UPI001FB19C6D|nr:protein ASPARTIC PROTEASE IN GUARD CELL 2-like [Impatiens glandulifera]